METGQQGQVCSDDLVKRIDALILALQELRRLVLAARRVPESDLTSKLYGVLGQGSWDEYDPRLDWQRHTS